MWCRYTNSVKVQMQQKRAERLATAMREQCIGVRVGRMHRIVNRSYENALLPLGISLPQLEMLSTLTIVAGPIRPTELADLLSVDRSTMSRNLAVLEARGWVETADTSPTGRSLSVRISTDGTVQLAAAERVWLTVQKKFSAALGDDPAATLDLWLNALSGA